MAASSTLSDRSSDALVYEHDGSNGGWRKVLLGGLSTPYAGNAHWMFGRGRVACLARVAWFSVLGCGARFLPPLFGRVRAWRVLDDIIAVSSC